MASLSKINVLFSVDMKQFSTDMQNSIRESEKWAKKWEASGKSMSLYVTAPLVAAGAASLKFASDFSESQNKVDVAFKDSSAQVRAFGKTTLETYGIAEGTALDMAALFGDMATSMGLPEKQAAKMSTSLVGLAGDLASFKNIGIAQATTALNGVFTGETESLKMLGIVMTEANLQQFALSQGIKKNLKDFTQAEKVQLRYAYVMQQTTNAQGDFARTGGGAANQARVFQEGLKEISVQIGNVLLPAFTSLLKKGNEFISWVASASDGQNQFAVRTALAAAAIGPLLVGVAKGVQAYNTLRQSALDGYKAIATNPYAALAVAVGALATVSLLSISRLNSLTDATVEYDKVMKGATQSIQKEKTAFELNFAVWSDVKRSYEDRKKAYDAVIASGGKFVEGLKFEEANSVKATEAADRYNEALIKRAEVQASFNKLVEVNQKLDSLKLGDLEAVKPDVWQNVENLATAYKNMGVNARFAGSSFGNFTATSVSKNLKSELENLEALKKKLEENIKGNEGFTESQNDVASATSGLNGIVESSVNSGTIAYYEKQISELKKLQNEVSKTSKSYGGYQDAIDALQKKIDTIKGVRVPVTFVLEGVEAPKLDLSAEKKHIDFLDAEIDRYTKLRGAYGPADAEYKNITKTIEGFQKLSDNAKSGNPIPYVEPVKQFRKAMTEAELARERFKLGMKDFNESMADSAMQFRTDFVASIAQGFGELAMGESTLGGIFKSLSLMLAEFVINIGKQLIAVGTASQAFQISLSNPATAIAVGFATVAAGAAFKAAFSKMDGFATGGLVDGNSFTGDNLMIRVNSGERVVSAEQQRWLERVSQPRTSGDVSAIEVYGESRISGQDIEIAFSRWLNTKNRLG